MKNQKLFFIIFFNILIFTQSLYAVEVAPRISDREIIESLADLKAGQKVINQRFEGMENNIDQRFKNIDQQFKSIDQRFDDMGKRFDHIWNLMLIIITGIFGLIGFIVWDRKTALRPLEKRMDTLEKDIQHDLELRHEKDSLVTRLLQSLRDLAKHDEKLADILRSYSLL